MTVRDSVDGRERDREKKKGGKTTKVMFLQNFSNILKYYKNRICIAHFTTQRRCASLETRAVGKDPGM